MLFSQESVASFVNENFEPTWETVRPVPIVRIDFGNGTVVTRTLHGNIATYVCTPDGQVVDILPGIYTPAVYVNRLKRFRLLASYVAARGPEAGEAFLRDYHRTQAKAPTDDPAPRPVGLRVAIRRGDVTKMVGVENRLEGLVASGGAARQAAGPDRGEAQEDLHLGVPEDLANWKLLAEDTRQNETVRRKLIHEMLAASGPVKPEQLTKRLYKEVLHADLDDPYLGLKDVLFASYPFKEDRPPSP